MDLISRWDEARLLWYAKGWTIEAVAQEIEAKPELAQFKLSSQTLQRRSVSARYIPKPVAELVEGLTARADHQHLAEIVESGLRVLAGQPPVSYEPEKLAQALIEHFPADEVALELAEALRKQASLASGTGSVFDVVAQAIAGRLPHTPRLRLPKLLKRLRRNSAKLEKLRTTLRRGIWAVAGILVIGFVALGALLVALVSARAGGPASGVGFARGGVVGDAAGGPHWAVIPFLGSFLSGETGEKASPELYIPDQPLPGQKRTGCDPDKGEQLINGGCWGAMAHVAPPCRKLYRHGNECYRPIAEDPLKPIGGGTAQEPRRMDAAMPGKEQ